MTRLMDERLVAFSLQRSDEDEYVFIEVSRYTLPNRLDGYWDCENGVGTFRRWWSGDDHDGGYVLYLTGGVSAERFALKRQEDDPSGFNTVRTVLT